MNAQDKDISTVQGKEKADVASLLTQAARESGRSPFAIAFDFFKLKRKRGKLRLYEFILYNLFDKGRWT